jgi:hypothetical protein
VSHDEIGRTIININELPENEEHDMWLDITSQGEHMEHKAEKRMRDRRPGFKMSKGQRRAKGLVRGITGANTSGCQLHVKVRKGSFEWASETIERIGRTFPSPGQLRHERIFNPFCR